MSRKKLLLFFIDGIGLGEDDPEINPLRGLFSPVMDGNPFVARSEPLFFSHGVLIPTDPIMGVPGVPQSATGQTSIFTGLNAQEHLGFHLTGYPNPELKALIERRSLMKRLIDAGVRTTAANLYSQEFFEQRQSRDFFPASTLVIRASGAPFRYWPDYVSGKAVFADITNELIRNRGYDVELIEPEVAAKHMIQVLDDDDFVFFEYFMTDLHGHKRNRKELERCVEVLNRFTSSLWGGVDRSTTGVLVVSDHGNAEDVVRGGHTMNMVPTLLLRTDETECRRFAETVSRLTDIYPAVLRTFGVDVG